MFGRHSIEYPRMHRPIVHLTILMVSVDISTTILSVVYRSTIGYILVDCWSSISRYSTEYRSTVGQHLFSLKVQLQLTNIWVFLIKCIGSILLPSNAYIDRYRSRVSQVSTDVKYRWSIGQESVKYQWITKYIDQYSVEYGPMYGSTCRSRAPIRYMILQQLLCYEYIFNKYFLHLLLELWAKSILKVN